MYGLHNNAGLNVRLQTLVGQRRTKQMHTNDIVYLA